MTSAFDPLPSDLAAAHAMILAERAARVEAEAVAACAQAVNVSTGALIAHLKLEIEKLRRACPLGRAAAGSAGKLHRRDSRFLRCSHYNQPNGKCNDRTVRSKSFPTERVMLMKTKGFSEVAPRHW